MVKDFVQAILLTQSTYRQAIHRKIREHNIDVTFEMLHIMRSLAGEGKMNQQELADKTFKDKSSLSYLIKNMEKRGLVRREEDERDKRNKFVLFTEKGRALYGLIDRLIIEVYEKIAQETNEEHLKKCIEYMYEFNKSVKES